MSVLCPCPVVKTGKSQFRQLLIVAAVASALAGCGKDPMVSGAEFMKQGDFNSAVIEFKNATQAKPESLEARLALADALEKTYDTVGAEQHLRKALERGGDANVLLPRIALLMLDRNELEKLIHEFKDKRLTSAEADAGLRGVVASAYVAQKRLPQAGEQLKGITVKNPAVQLAKAQLLLAQGKPKDAIAQLDDAFTDPQAPWWILRALSRLAFATGNQAQSLEIIKRAHDAAPWHRGVMGEYGEALITAGRLEEAIPLRNQLKKSAPNYFWTHYLDAVVLAREGKSEASHAAALRVLAVSPDHLPAVLFAAAAEIRKGDFLMADSRLRKISKLHPYSLPTQQLLALTQFRTGKMEESLDTIRRGLSVSPHDQQLLALRADIELKKGAPKEAMATLASILAANPNDAVTLLRLSELKAQTGNKAEALTLLDKAASATTDPELTNRIVAFTLRLGEVAKATQLAENNFKAHPKSAQSQLTLAATYAGRKDAAGAWRATLAALDLDPGYAPALKALVASATTPEQQKEIVGRYSKAVAAKTTDPLIYIDYANMVRGESKDSGEATRVLEAAVNALPAATNLRKALIGNYLRSGNADKALSTAQAGAAAANAPAEANALLGQTYEQLGKTDQAIDIFRKLAANYPQRADWRLRLATLEIEADHKKEATTILRALITDRPFDSTAYMLLANLTVKNSPAEALSVARQLGEREEHKLAAMLLEGDLLFQSGKTDDALKQFSKAGKAGAQPAAMLRIAKLLDQTGRGSAADQELLDAQRKYPDDLSVMVALAQHTQSQGKQDKAIELYQKIAAKSPNNPIALNDLAWAQVLAKKPEALANAKKASEILPDNANILDTLGMAQSIAGQKKEAIATLRTAVNIAPKTATPRLHLADLLLQENDKAGASALLQSIDAKQLNNSEQAMLQRLKASQGS